MLSIGRPKQSRSVFDPRESGLANRGRTILAVQTGKRRKSGRAPKPRKTNCSPKLQSDLQPNLQFEQSPSVALGNLLYLRLRTTCVRQRLHRRWVVHRERIVSAQEDSFAPHQTHQVGQRLGRVKDGIVPKTAQVVRGGLRRRPWNVLITVDSVEAPNLVGEIASAVG